MQRLGFRRTSTHTQVRHASKKDQTEQISTYARAFGPNAATTLLVHMAIAQKATTNIVAPTISFEHSVVKIQRWKQDATPSLVIYIPSRKHWLALRGAREGTIAVRSSSSSVEALATDDCKTCHGVEVAQCWPSSLALEDIQRIVQGFLVQWVPTCSSQHRDKRLWIYARTGCEYFLL